MYSYQNNDKKTLLLLCMRKAMRDFIWNKLYVPFFVENPKRIQKVSLDLTLRK